jgi:hypothetical protein
VAGFVVAMLIVALLTVGAAMDVAIGERAKG